MRKVSKIKAISFIALFFFGFIGLMAQDVTTVEAMSDDISKNLDLEAVASVFGDAADLEDFERKLNDPKTQISNLDLNRDGYVDYLRVVEVAEGRTHLIAIQAVLGNDQYQDVATIEVEKDNNGKTHVQIVGDVYMYGQDYIIEPIYVHRPVFFRHFWSSFYRPYCSSYYWGYYPYHFHYWSPFHTHIYRRNVYAYINVHHTYHHVYHRRSHVAARLHNVNRRNDYGRKHPARSYTNRSGNLRKDNVSRRATTTRHGVTNNRARATSTANWQQRRTKRGVAVTSKNNTPQRRVVVTKPSRNNNSANKRGRLNNVKSPRTNRVATRSQSRNISRSTTNNTSRKPSVTRSNTSQRQASNKSNRTTRSNNSSISKANNNRSKATRSYTSKNRSNTSSNKSVRTQRASTKNVSSRSSGNRMAQSSTKANRSNSRRR